MFLSFIVPVYNTEKYLRDCLDSLISQDVPKEDYEIICVNDGSTDGSLTILQEYADQYSNIRIINKENGGLSSARNAGLDVARGDYIWFVDSDDFIQINILKYFKGIIEEIKYDRINFGTYTFHEALSESEKKQVNDGGLKSNTYLYNIIVCNNIFALNYLKNNDLFFRYPEIKHSEDGIFMFESSLANPKELVVETVGYYYRRRSGSLTTSRLIRSHEMRVISYRTVSKVLLQYYIQKLGDLSYLADLLMSNIWTLMNSVAYLPLKTSFAIINQLKEDGLFPLKRPPECTLVRSYQTTRTDFIGKTFDWIYIHSHTRIGFFLLRLWHAVYSVYEKFK